MTITHQASEQCSCGSWYRNGDRCNKCGKKTDDKIKEAPKMQVKKLKRLWSKKMHRYLTQDEIKKGMLGG